MEELARASVDRHRRDLVYSAFRTSMLTGYERLRKTH